MPIILVINSGSSSLKASLFAADGMRQDFNYPHIGRGKLHDQHEAFAALIRDLGTTQPDVIGHRLVHGGAITDAARLIDATERSRLDSIIPLAPLHLPSNLLGVDVCLEHFGVPQVACFDTAFHATLPLLAQRLPIPQELGYRRYGFHGINYAYIAQQLPAILGDAAKGKIVVAHLGSGASLCMLDNLKSVDTTMAYTPAGGIPMGTRSGDLDPGVMLALSERYTTAQLSDLIYHHMGLIALSDGLSSDMSQLLASDTDTAQFAVEYFCQQVRGAIGALAAKAGGIDALVFTAGIGEHAALVRSKVCTPLAFLGLALAAERNATHQSQIHATGSKPILIIPADEESMICSLVSTLMSYQVNLSS
ncbi:acetate/propionate family kinase [Sulfuriferula nivalis]|uniref:Acetate kinase n=1 Tax=Sulfuriferula nivalis TaxID=2675298 RepID=A0A809RKP1_9PROT|nr:acetate kinase [Sulfuriferula nivalis]BBO99330.1 acetate kinase [Sulfuriferula nivalis]